MNTYQVVPGPDIPPKNIPAAYLNVGIMIHAELRVIRAQLSHLLAHLSNKPTEDLDASYAKEGEKTFDETWAELLAKLGK